MADEFCLKMPDFHVTFRDLLHARKSTTCDKRLYFPSEGKRAEEFFALKNPTASVGFELKNLSTRGQHATSRPPKPLHWRFDPEVSQTQDWEHKAMQRLPAAETPCLQFKVANTITVQGTISVLLVQNTKSVSYQQASNCLTCNGRWCSCCVSMFPGRINSSSNGQQAGRKICENQQCQS